MNDNGVALRWVMTATVQDDSLGPDAKGKQWRSEGMTYLVFDGDKVVREVDYHDSGAVPRSFGIAAKRPADVARSTSRSASAADSGATSASHSKSQLARHSGSTRGESASAIPASENHSKVAR